MHMNDLFSLEQKEIILTGAAGFFGVYFAKALLGAGAGKVFLLDKDEERLVTLKQSLQKEFDKEKIVIQPIDQYNRIATSEILKNLVEKDNITVLINNSFDFSTGTGFNDEKGRIETATFDHIMRSFESGIYWPFQATQILANKLSAEKKKGTIINIGSMYSLVSPNPDLYKGRDYFNPPGYSMIKSAVLALTRYTASFYGPYVRANALLPGAIPNIEHKSDNSEQNKDDEFMQRLIDRTLLKRVGHPTDLIGPIIFLASDASSYMTGQGIVVDGGWVVT